MAVTVATDSAALVAQRRHNAVLARMPHPDPRTPRGLRRIRAAGPPPARLGITPIDRFAGALRVRVFAGRPPASGLVVRLHGGGFAAGTPEHDDALNDRIARACRAVVASPAYRLAPDVTIPDQIADCVSAVRWAARAFPSGPLVLAGTSAGAYLALSAAIALRGGSDGSDGSGGGDGSEDQLFPRIAGLHLDCGRYDLAGTPSARAADRSTLVLTRDWLDRFLELAAPGLDREALRSPARSPLYAPLAGLPPALLTVGALDPLRDDTVLLEAALCAAGCVARAEIWPEAPHSFMASGTPLAEQAFAGLCAWIDRRLEYRP